MYNINMLITIAGNALDAEHDYLAYCRDTRRELGLYPNTELWIPGLDGSKAFRLGELSERSSQKWSSVAEICNLLGIDQDRLIAATKSISRWEENHGHYDRVVHVCKDNSDGRRLARFLCKDENSRYYKSTGRIKAWCKQEETDLWILR